MIVDTLENLERYCGIHPNLDTALAFVRDTDLASLPAGRTVIDGERVFVNVVETTTAPADGRAYEYHKHYIDLHLDIEGEESIAISTSAPRPLGAFDEEGDGGLCEPGEPGSCFVLGRRCFGMAFPMEPHLPLVCGDAPAALRKCIVKIRTDE